MLKKLTPAKQVLKECRNTLFTFALPNHITNKTACRHGRSSGNLRARSLVVSDLRLKTKGSRYESGC